MSKKLQVCWISAGVSSFVAGWLEKENTDQYIYLDELPPDAGRQTDEIMQDCGIFCELAILGGTDNAAD